MERETEAAARGEEGGENRKRGAETKESWERQRQEPGHERSSPEGWGGRAHSMNGWRC